MDIKDKLKQALKNALSGFGLPEIEPQIEHPENPENGDYATNVALVVGKKSGKNPMDLAKKIKENVEKVDGVERVEVAAPGFVNFWLSEAAFSKELELALDEDERYPSTALRAGGNKDKTVVVEYSSPNIAKRFGIGHLRSTIIGQSIYNLYRFLGYNAIGDNHLGDWGTQFGTITYQIISNNLSLDSLSVDLLESLYVDFNKKAKENPELWEEARKWFKKLEDGDERAREIWAACTKVSMDEFNKIYGLLNVKIDNAYGESFYQDKMGAIIKEAKDKKIAVEDQGALIIKYGDLPPGILLKSDWGTTYLTRDLATVKFRLENWNPDRIIYEVGVEQTLHFQQVFKAVEMLGWTTRDKLVHVRHGLYLSPEGRKFATRRGETIKLEDVLNEAVERAKLILKAKPDADEVLSESEVAELAKAVGIGAVKYFDLSHHPASDIIFSWEKMFLLTGNSGPYLQYTVARALSVLRKAKIYDLRFTIYDLRDEEFAILRTFYKFPEVVEATAHQYAPNLLCNFLYEFASKYNLMYNNLAILEAESEEKRSLRLALTQVTANILKTGLGLLGIQSPERM